MRRRITLIGAALVAATGITMAFAATLQVSSSKLTTFDVTQAAPTTTTTTTTPTTTPPSVAFFVPDGSSKQLYRYTSAFALVGTATDLDAANTQPRGAATISTDVLVLDSAGKVYRYSSSGTLVSTSRALSLASNGTVAGLAVDGNDLYVLEDINGTNSNDVIRRFSLSSAFTSGTALSPAATYNLVAGSPGGLGIDSSYVFVGSGDKKVHRYPKNDIRAATVNYSKVLQKDGSSTAAIDSAPIGLTASASSIWVTTAGSPGTAYEFNTSSLGFASPAPTGGANAAVKTALATNNIDPQGL